MPQIRIYQFSPKTQPPSQIHKMYHWLKAEVSAGSIDSVDAYDISKNNLIKGNGKHLSFAIKLFKGLAHLKKVSEWYKQRW